MGRATIVACAVLLAAGGGAIGYGVTRDAAGGMTPENTAAMATAVATLDGDLKAARAAVEQRAKTLAEVGTVRAAAGTDAATAMDMVGREISFKPAPGEVIELGQIPRGGAAMSLVILPRGGMRSTYSGQVGAFAELMQDRLLVTQTVSVVPADPQLAAEVTGFVTVSRSLDLVPALDRLAQAGLSGRIEVGDQRRVFGSPPPEDRGDWQPMPVPSQPGVQIVAAVPPKIGGVPVPLVGAGAGAAALGAILLLIGMLTGRDRHTGATESATGAGMTPTGVGPTPAPSSSSTPGLEGASAAGSIAETIVPGTMIGRWEVVRRLGSGGMADVYLAHVRGEAGFEKLVALKVMHPHLARLPRAVEHFLDEARLAARVTHPNVVQIQDLGKIGGDYVIAMEYVEGADLERLLASARFAQRPVPVHVGLGILCRICDGLHAAHTATAADGTPLGIIHRDVKSANVLVSKQGGVKVVDFGIAKAATQSHLTVAGEAKGTPSMMAPEQRVGDQVDVRADVYSAAAVAYEVLTGLPVNLDLAALAHLGIDNWPHLPAPSSVRPELPVELDGILLTAMAFERERRPADCATFAGMFEALMQRHNLACSDKDIARWAELELAQLHVPGDAGGDGTGTPASAP